MRKENQDIDAPQDAATISAERLAEIHVALKSGQNVELTPEEEQAIINEIESEAPAYNDDLLGAADDLPITYSGSPDDEISAETLKELYRRLAHRPRLRFKLPPAMQAKRAASRTRNRKKNKLAKTSRRANRRVR